MRQPYTLILNVCILLHLSLFLLPLKLLQHGLILLLLLLGLLDGGLALLLISHGHYSQDQVDQVEGAKENHQHKEYHVGFARSPQCLGRGNKSREKLVIFRLPRSFLFNIVIFHSATRKNEFRAICSSDSL